MAWAPAPRVRNARHRRHPRAMRKKFQLQHPRPERGGDEPDGAGSWGAGTEEAVASMLPTRASLRTEMNTVRTASQTRAYLKPSTSSSASSPSAGAGPTGGGASPSDDAVFSGDKQYCCSEAYEASSG